jgi:hypothetical protein
MPDSLLTKTQGEKWPTLPAELQDMILGYLNLSDLVALANVGAFTHRVKAHVFHKVGRLFSRWDLPEISTRAKMKETETVLSGSAALATVMPVNYQPGDLDFYSSLSGAIRFREFLLSANYVEVEAESINSGLQESSASPAGMWRQVPMVRDENDECAYVVHAGMKRIFTFFHKTQGYKINLIQSSAESALATIFLFHSTVVMNWVSHCAVSCAYPKLTLAYKGTYILLRNCNTTILISHRPQEHTPLSHQSSHQGVNQEVQ